MTKKIDLILRSTISAVYFTVFFLSFWAPVIQHFKGYPAGEGIYSLFSPVCHQYPTRCFWIFDRPWALCARCASAYLGLSAAAILLRPRLPFLKRALIGTILVAIAAIDPAIQLLGFYESINFARLITGLMGGIGAFLLFYPIPLKFKDQTI
jgi:uncharacterized membrane protein